MSVRLTTTVVEIERHVAAGGWDQPVRLYALVPTADLVSREPSLASALGIDPEAVTFGDLTPVEQDELPDLPLDELLAGIGWPAEVVGTAVVVERMMLPPSAEEAIGDLSSADAETVQAIGEHPDREEVRIAVGVLRDGDTECVLRLRSRDNDQDVLSGAELVPGLAEALRSTLL